MWPQVCVTIGGSDHLIAPRPRTVFADPWISVGDHAEGVSGGSLVYAEASFRWSSHVDGLASHRGGNVFIRQNHLTVELGSMFCEIDVNGCATVIANVTRSRFAFCRIRVNVAGTLTATQFNNVGNVGGLQYCNGDGTPPQSVTVVQFGDGRMYCGNAGPSSVAVAASSTFSYLERDYMTTNEGWTICLTQLVGSDANSSSTDDDAASSASAGTIVGITVLVCCLLGLAATGLSLRSMKHKSPLHVNVAPEAHMSESEPDESGGFTAPNQRPPSRFNAVYQPVAPASEVKLLDDNEPDPNHYELRDPTCGELPNLTYGELPDPTYSELSPAPLSFEAPVYSPIPTSKSFPLAPTADSFAGQHLVVAPRPPHHQDIIPDRPPPSFAEAIAAMRTLQMPPAASQGIGESQI